ESMSHTALIDLTSSKIKIHTTEPARLDKWLGGRGLGASILFDNVDVSTRPLDPGNYLIFTTGPLNGTLWPTSSRYHVTFKSPATGAYGYANAGGHFGPELRYAGYDAIVITGKALEPVIIQIFDDEITLLPAKDYWGHSTSFVEKSLREEYGGRVASIGQAGENLVYMAAIINDGGRAAARSGPGAVMGSKNLKALHVRSDRKKTSSPIEFAKLAKGHSKYLLDDPNSRLLREQSTLFLMAIKNAIGDLPAKNHQTGQVPFIRNLDAEAFSRYWTKRLGCAMCTLRCSRQSALKTGGKDIQIEGPEYETADAFGPMCWNADPEVVIETNYLCNEYGLDTISTGVTIAFALECHEKGLLDHPDHSLEWGDSETILGLTRDIAFRTGLGELLSKGVLRAAREIGNGAEKYAMHVKGLEIPRQEPRIAKSFGLGHATSNRGADHLYGMPALDLAGNWEVARKLFPEEILTELMELSNEKYKADIVIYGEHFCAVVDSLGVCKFSTAETYALMPADLAVGLRALGYNFTAESLLEIGERIVNLERLFNQMHGFGRKDDTLPQRFTTEPLDVYEYEAVPDSDEDRRSESPIATGIIHDWDAMLDRYYELRGWDENGHPLPQTLTRLGL
ncbi:MAG: aldehyde ferredoxin oxidoreductase family protein, partial [Chloroflexi bacterium]|nr:aldehyde ferredoxin oxidoreductase family protein [Chloroflexota bacterium]